MRKIKGFTLIELMIVAIPAFLRYIKRSKTSEALMNIRKLYDGEVAYYEDERVDSSGNVLPKMFIHMGDPEGNVQPSGDAGCGCPNHPTKTKCGGPGCFTNFMWQNLNFSVDGPVYFQYNTVANNTEPEKNFTVFAFGDLDGDRGAWQAAQQASCDGTARPVSCFMRSGNIDTETQEIEGEGGIQKYNELE